MTISDIKRLTAETSPHFFDRKSLRFFGQTMRSFRVVKQSDGRYLISAPMKDSNGVFVGQTIRYFNPKTNKLDHK